MDTCHGSFLAAGRWGPCVRAAEWPWLALLPCLALVVSLYALSPSALGQVTVAPSSITVDGYDIASLSEAVLSNRSVVGAKSATKKVLPVGRGDLQATTAPELGALVLPRGRPAAHQTRRARTSP